MRQPRPRQGSTLVELLVALPLALLAAAAAALLLIHVARAARTQSAALSTSRELRHARLLLTAELEPLDGRDLVLVTDTLLEVRSHVGVLLVCDGRDPANLLVSVPAGTADQWVSTLRIGDDVRGWQPSSAAGEAPEDRASRLRETPTSVAHAPCLANERVAVPRWRLLLADSTLSLLPGAPILVRRDTRLQHYRSAGAWWLGRRQRDGALWDGLQPAAGPFASPADRGIRLRAMTSGEIPVVVLAPLADSTAERVAGIEVALRAPRRVPGVGGARVDSASTLVAFRATASDRRQP